MVHPEKSGPEEGEDTFRAGLVGTEGDWLPTGLSK